MSRTNSTKKPVGFATHVVAGGLAGGCEALTCQPLDTIKVRMQLSRSSSLPPGSKPRSFLATGLFIVRRETPLALYKGLGAVLGGIIPKMAIRFASFEWYKKQLSSGAVTPSPGVIFLSGLLAGGTEAVTVVTPTEVIKIRLQAQSHSLADPLSIPKYRNAAHCVYTILREEGFGALYRGVGLTIVRQGSNQAVNFTVFQELKKRLEVWQEGQVQSWQHMGIGLISGACGPLSNAPIDTIKTRLQKSPSKPGETSMGRVKGIVADMWRKEGMKSFYKGITPRILRVAPGQAVVFAVYERVRGMIEGWEGDEGGDWEE